ncbi:hypothetical protein D3C75_1199320 [compost metagenome]
MHTQGTRLRLAYAGRCADLAPEHTSCSQLRHFAEHVAAHRKEEAHALAEGIDVQATFTHLFYVCAPVQEGQGQFEYGVCASFMKMVARDRDGVEKGQVRM